MEENVCNQFFDGKREVVIGDMLWDGVRRSLSRAAGVTSKSVRRLELPSQHARECLGKR